MTKLKHKIVLRLLEFFLVGVVMGVVEDILAILLATDAKIDMRVIGVALFVAIPFAIISELIVDLPSFQRKGHNWLKRYF